MKKIFTIVLILILSIVLVACSSQSEKVTYNLRREAEEFNVRRRITVMNTRTDTALMQITGLLSIDVDNDGDLNITIEKAPGEYVLNYSSSSSSFSFLQRQSVHTP